MLDLERLAGMEADFGAEELALILAAFREEATNAVDALRAGWMDDAIRRDRLHFLKGSARTIGARRLGDLCEELETAAPQKDGWRVLEQELAVICEALDRGSFLKPG